MSAGNPHSLNDWVAVVTLSLATWLLAPTNLVAVHRGCNRAESNRLD